MGNALVRYSLLIIRPPDPALYQLGFRGIGGLVVIIQYPVKRAVAVESGINIRQEGRHGLGSLAGI